MPDLLVGLSIMRCRGPHRVAVRSGDDDERAIEVQWQLEPVGRTADHEEARPFLRGHEGKHVRRLAFDQHHVMLQSALRNGRHHSSVTMARMRSRSPVPMIGAVNIGPSSTNGV